MFSDDDRLTVRREALRMAVRRHSIVGDVSLFGVIGAILLRPKILLPILFVGAIAVSMLWEAIPVPIHVFVEAHRVWVAVGTWVAAGAVLAAVVAGHGRRGRGAGVAAVVLLALAGWAMWP